MSAGNGTATFANVVCTCDAMGRIADNTQTYYIADGNKNIIALKDSSGADVSTYAYTPFGSLENPADGDENPFRFSSEYADDETGLVYYNYRYYSPQLGRWTKRDPIEEQGGSNLYALLNNNSINFMDKNGEISLASKIMTRLGGRVAKIPLFGLSGVIHNWISYSDPIVFEDEECGWPQKLDNLTWCKMPVN